MAQHAAQDTVGPHELAERRREQEEERGRRRIRIDAVLNPWLESFDQIGREGKQALKRLASELIHIRDDPTPLVDASPKPSDPWTWSGVIMGPPKTPYEGAVFFVELYFPTEYPFRPPKIKFLTPVYSASLKADEDPTTSCECCPAVCSTAFRDEWSPYFTIPLMLLIVSSHLANPELGFEEGVHQKTSHYLGFLMYKQNRQKYHLNAAEHAMKFAGGPGAWELGYVGEKQEQQVVDALMVIRRSSPQVYFHLRPRRIISEFLFWSKALRLRSARSRPTYLGSTSTPTSVATVLARLSSDEITAALEAADLSPEVLMAIEVASVAAAEAAGQKHER